MTRTDPETRRPSIADPYQDLLAPLDERYRRSLIRRLTQEFYEGWRPTRRELAALIAEDLGQRAPASAAPCRHDGAPPLRRTPAAGTVPGTSALPIGPSNAAVRPDRPRAHTTTSPTVIAKFQVNCGQLAPNCLFVARSLSTAGIVERGGGTCRLVYLTYELHPRLGSGEPQPTSPAIFTAPITCFPDRLVPWADDDGKDRQHTVVGSRVIGRRGPWPLAGTARRIQFPINRQTPAECPPSPSPAGRLIVDIRSGNAVWRPA